MRRRVALVEGSPHAAFGAISLGYHTYRRPRHRRRGGVGAATVFAVLLVLAGIEAAWFLQPVWRGTFAPAVVLAETTPPDGLPALGEATSIPLRTASEALA